MKIMIASDIHGALPALDRLLSAFETEQADELVLLGDLYYHGPRNPLPDGYGPMLCAERLNVLGERLLVVKGNCDAEIDETISRFPFLQNATLMVGAKKVFLSHGHRFNAETLPGDPCDVLFYGHTHVPCFVQKGKILAVNPGSVGYPKGGYPESYALMTEKGIQIKSLTGTVIDERCF